MGASDLHLWCSVYDYTSPSASGSRARQARDKRYWSVWVLVWFLQVGPGLAIPPFILSSWLTVWWIGKGAAFWEGRAQVCLIDGKGRAHLNGACSSLPDWWKGARSLEWGALTWKGRAQVCLIDENERAPVDQGALKANGTYSLLETYWFSIQYPDGVVQVVSTKGVAVSITGCRLETGVSQVFYYRQPSRQASTECPLPALKQLNFWMQISSQLSHFMTWSNDHCDLDFSLTVYDILRWPYRGHEAASEDTMLKRGGGVCGSLCPWCGGGGWNQLVRQVEEGGPRPCVVKCGDGWILVWLAERGARAQSCLVDWKGRARSKLPDSLKGARTFKVVWLIEMGALKVRGLVIFLLLLVAAKSWWKIDPLAVIQPLSFKIENLNRIVSNIWEKKTSWYTVQYRTYFLVKKSLNSTRIMEGCSGCSVKLVHKKQYIKFPQIRGEIQDSIQANIPFEVSF